MKRLMPTGLPGPSHEPGAPSATPAYRVGKNEAEGLAVAQTVGRVSGMPPIYLDATYFTKANFRKQRDTSNMTMGYVVRVAAAGVRCVAVALAVRLSLYKLARRRWPRRAVQRGPCRWRPWSP